MRAHSLLRSFPEVDAERTAVTGISWGGYTTCLAASLDDRFKAAVPVYGCGFLHEGESVQKPSIDKLGERKAEWVREYDPGSLLPRCRVPILFVNGTNDVHYVLDSYMKSFNVVPGEKQMRIQVHMPHGHQAGWAPEEIGLFIDSKCRCPANRSSRGAAWWSAALRRRASSRGACISRVTRGCVPSGSGRRCRRLFRARR
jgi:dienelactone hydrolase